MKRQLLIFLACAGLMAVQQASAASLWDVYQQAQNSDPTYQAAVAQEMSDAEAVPASIAELLPTIQYAAGASLNKTMINNSDATTALTTTTQRQRTIDWTLSLTESVFNFANWKNLFSAKDSVKASAATFNAATQALMRRVEQAYFAVLNAQDVLQYTTAEKRAFHDEYKQANTGFKVGVNTITDVYNAKAAYDGAVADNVTAVNGVASAKEDLRAITNIKYDDLQPLNATIPLVTPRPRDIEQWVATANQQNWELIAARYTAMSKHQLIWAKRSGHLPTVDFSADYDNTLTRTFRSGRTRTKGPSASLDLTVPIFSGGSVTSATRKAMADYEVAQQNQEATYRSVATAARQNYLDVMSDISKINADQQAIISNTSSVSAMKAGYKVGTRTIVDVLNAEKALYNAKKTWAGDRYDYINKLIKLKESSGTLSTNDLIEVNNWLSNGMPKKKMKKVAVPVRAVKKTAGRYVQVGAYDQRQVAEQVATRVKARTHLSTRVYAGRHGSRFIYRVQVGPLQNNMSVKKAQSTLNAASFKKTFVVN